MPYLHGMEYEELTELTYIKKKDNQSNLSWTLNCGNHDDVVKWKHFPRYWPFVQGIHRSPVNSPHKGQWRRALMISLICVWINGWVNNPEVGDLRCYLAHFDFTVMLKANTVHCNQYALILHFGTVCYGSILPTPYSIISRAFRVIVWLTSANHQTPMIWRPLMSISMA